jgi:hypothetical protein
MFSTRSCGIQWYRWVPRPKNFCSVSAKPPIPSSYLIVDYPWSALFLNVELCQIHQCTLQALIVVHTFSRRSLRKFGFTSRSRSIFLRTLLSSTPVDSSTICAKLLTSHSLVLQGFHRWSYFPIVWGAGHEPRRGLSSVKRERSHVCDVKE